MPFEYTYETVMAKELMELVSEPDGGWEQIKMGSLTAVVKSDYGEYRYSHDGLWRFYRWRDVHVQCFFQNENGPCWGEVCPRDEDGKGDAISACEAHAEYDFRVMNNAAKYIALRQHWPWLTK